MKQFIIPVVASCVLLSLIACSGSSNGGGSNNPPAPTPQIVPNGNYDGSYQTVPAIPASMAYLQQLL